MVNIIGWFTAFLWGNSNGSGVSGVWECMSLIQRKGEQLALLSSSLIATMGKNCLPGTEHDGKTHWKS